MIYKCSGNKGIIATKQISNVRVHRTFGGLNIEDWSLLVMIQYDIGGN